MSKESGFKEAPLAFAPVGIQQAYTNFAKETVEVASMYNSGLITAHELFMKLSHTISFNWQVEGKDSRVNIDPNTGLRG